MKFSILIPHFSVGKMTAYTIAQLLKYKGKHDIDILVIDNNAGDGSAEYLKPFAKQIKYQAYPKDRLQSHGIAFDYILPHVHDEWFITIESDSFPTQNNWLDYYEDLINQGYESAGSLLRLSGGEYNHPAGGLYNKKIWQEAKRYCNAVEYAYFPNMTMKEGFACHTMIHKTMVEKVMSGIYNWLEPAGDYGKMTKNEILGRMMYYSPVVAPFHNGMGRAEESVKTYGFRNLESEVPNILLDNKRKIINRIGYEPGQFMSYFQRAKGKKVFDIPTEVKWIEGKEGHQQEYTLMENGFKHIWGVSAYKDVDPNDEIAKIKQALPEQLYETLPEHQKIKTI